ncbi:M20 family metallopeptidase [Miniphocaeibacter halophilus]|uniref:M20 family metallopeptidase n=1 Tax=Miniphocaeibacter halophilus TaxID=2931922 RepID=A0AC61MXP8_9FIRM|nr:M20 family metallopeptidase [Miniphocaeibacter halophilus]QQK08356.1 M20 family metallopeptidase [Miniphocaeibacter halophilus]
MISKDKIKKEVEILYSEKQEQLEKISHYIHDNPEIEFTEYKAQKILSDYLEENGFDVRRGIGGIETSFEAVYNNGEKGTNIAFLAEYDALKDIGHACGHNIIGTTSTGAGVIVKELMEKYDIPGTIRVIGTPAEEGAGGKVIMLDHGVFKGLDAALIMHPAEDSMPDDISFASANIKYTFTGVPSHAAAFPWKGKNALTGVIQMFNMVDSQRIHLKDYSRVHGIILEGGTAHNVITEKASALFNIRALNYEYLLEIMNMLKNCAEGSALGTGTKVEIEVQGNILKDIRNNNKLVNLVRNNMELFEEDYIERDLSQGIGSTDMANVTHEIPAIQFYIRLRENTGTHTKEFEIASGDEHGERTLKQAVKVLSMTGLELLLEAKEN